jgi:hypothetical protein
MGAQRFAGGTRVGHLHGLAEPRGSERLVVPGDLEAADQAPLGVRLRVRIDRARDRGSQPGARRPAGLASASSFSRYSLASSGETRSSTMRSAWSAATANGQVTEGRHGERSAGRVQAQPVVGRSPGST